MSEEKQVLNLSGANIVDIGERLSVPMDIRGMLTILGVGARIAIALKAVLPGLTQPEQRFICTVVGFRIMGGMLPASVEMITRLPMFSGIDAGHVTGIANALCDNEILSVEAAGNEMSFYWPALEKLIHVAITEADAPKVVGTDGNPLY